MRRVMKACMRDSFVSDECRTARLTIRILAVASEFKPPKDVQYVVDIDPLDMP
jgi:hypothetical protein